LKELLSFGNFEPVVSVEHETVSKPVPDKVLDDMRSCSAAIIHVGTEMRLLDEAGTEHRIINPNVLIEIGAAMTRTAGDSSCWSRRATSCPRTSRGSTRSATRATRSTTRRR
jgi:hypothetical protein